MIKNNTVVKYYTLFGFLASLLNLSHDPSEICAVVDTKWTKFKHILNKKKEKNSCIPPYYETLEIIFCGNRHYTVLLVQLLHLL